MQEKNKGGNTWSLCQCYEFWARTGGYKSWNSYCANVSEEEKNEAKKQIKDWLNDQNQLIVLKPKYSKKGSTK